MSIKQIKNISILGVGLIGGSIGLALKSRTKKIKVTGIGRNFNRLKLARKIGAVDKITTDWKNGVKQADVIFVCLPVSLIVPAVQKILPYCKKNAVITDVGSVKKTIVSAISSPNFIGGHPIAGSEKQSVKYASAGLFENATVVLTPTAKTRPEAVNIIKELWEKMKAEVKIMSATRHDKILSFTSHLPHLVAFSLVNSVDSLEFIGSGFRDTTRIAASDPEMWAEIIFQNRTNVRAAIKKFKKELSKIENAKTQKSLTDIFKRAKIKKDTLERILSTDTLLKFIKLSRQQRQMSPSVREVAKYFRVSVSTAHQYLKKLYNYGLIRKRTSPNSLKMVARGITLKKLKNPNICSAKTEREVKEK